MLKISRLSKSLALVSAMMCGVACGGSTNNDQGTSFLALGFFIDDETSQTGAFTPLATDFAQLPSAAAAGTVPVQSDGAALFTFIGLENRLSSQYIRLERVDCRYDVPGADPTFQVPDESFNITAIIGPGSATDDTQEPADAILEEAFYAQFSILSPDIFSYLNVNRNSLPELPFRVIATCSAIGISEAGDVFRTNEVTLNIVVTDPAECCTGAPSEEPVSGGFQDPGPGTGGDLVTDGAASGGTGAATLPADTGDVTVDTTVDTTADTAAL